MTPGQKMQWHKIVSNYGHVRVIPVTVVKVGKRVTVETPLRGGGTRKAVVNRESLKPMEATL